MIIGGYLGWWIGERVGSIMTAFLISSVGMTWTRIWQTYYEPKPLSELYTGWQEMLAEHRQLIVEVQEIAEETGWRGPTTKYELVYHCEPC